MRAKEFILERNAISLPQSIVSKFDRLIEWFTENFKELQTKVSKTTSATEDLFYPPEFRDYFQIKTLKGTPLIFSVAIYNTPRAAAGFCSKQLKTIALNVSSLSDAERLKQIFYHELVHAIDPISGTGEYNGVSNGKVTNRQVYQQNTNEFNAESASTINSMRQKMNALPPDEKINFKKKVRHVLSSIPTVDVYDTDSLPSEFWEIGVNDYTWLDSWSKSPKLWKHFLQKVSAEILMR